MEILPNLKHMRRSHSSSITTAFIPSLIFMLIILLSSISSAAFIKETHRRENSLVFRRLPTPHLQPPPQPPPMEEGDRYEVEYRVVPSGPDPLHN